MRIDGKVALVTGAASGIGAAVAGALAGAGAAVALADIDQEALARMSDRLAEGGARVLPIALDVADRASWRLASGRIRDTFGGAQILFNNAGVSSRRAPIGELSPEIWDRLIGINLTGVFNGSRTFLSELLADGEPGHIVNTASIVGLLSVPALGAYVASKFAVVGLSETMRFELADRGVGVSVLCPGFVSTAIVRNSVRPQGSEAAPTGPGGERRALADRLASALPPEIVADRVLEGIAANLPYIFTHPEYGPAVERRFSLIGDALRGSPPNPSPEDTEQLAGAWLRAT